jgi:hypothetical protein
VTAGKAAGINANDDIFTKEETWAARNTPILKPMNWQHQDNDIIGVIYNVEARDLEGNILDLDSDEPPCDEFDIFIDAAVYKYIHAEKAQEIEQRTRASNLFVSMEAWFDDYEYGLCNEEQLYKVISRNEHTSHLDKLLRANKGQGKFYDEHAKTNANIGRVLKSFTFGACGFVDDPANKRSEIVYVDHVPQAIGVQTTGFIQTANPELYGEVIWQEPYTVTSTGNIYPKEEELMSSHASKEADVKAAVKEVLTEQEKQRAQAAAKEALEGRATAAETKQAELETELKEVKAEKTEAEAKLEKFEGMVKAWQDQLDKLIANAGAQSTPPEISVIDASTDGDSAFKAKIAWVEKSMAALKAQADKVEDLESDLQEAAASVRESQVRHTLAELLPEDTVDALVARAKQLSDEDYEVWFAEKKLLAGDMAEKEKTMKGKEGKEEKKEEAKGNIFEELLDKRTSEARSEGGNPTLINEPGGEDMSSGVNPGSLRSPRHKIAGSTAGNDPADQLENVQVEDGVNLAGASLGENDESENPFTSAIAEMFDVKKEGDK